MSVPEKLKIILNSSGATGSSAKESRYCSVSPLCLTLLQPFLWQHGHATSPVQKMTKLLPVTRQIFQARGTGSVHPPQNSGGKRGGRRPTRG